MTQIIHSYLNFASFSQPHDSEASFFPLENKDTLSPLPVASENAHSAMVASEEIDHKCSRNRPSNPLFRRLKKKNLFFRSEIAAVNKAMKEDEARAKKAAQKLKDSETGNS